MLGILLSQLLTISTHNGTLNYMYRKPQNGPRFIRASLAPNQAKTSVFLLSKNIVQNMDIELTLTNNVTGMLSLLYDSVSGVSFEFVRLQVTCDACKRLSFAPALQTPMLGLFWCVVNITKMQYMYAPQMTAIKGCHFYVNQFLVEKGRFQTFIDNYVYSSNSVQTPKYAAIGGRMGESFAQENAQQCLSCTNSNFTRDSQCTCGADGVMKSGTCYNIIKPTELISDTNKTIQYFLQCGQANRSVIELDVVIDGTEAVEYRTFLETGCQLGSFVLKGKILVNQTGSLANHIFGISNKLQNQLIDVNISLDIRQINDGMGSSTLMFNELEGYAMISKLRLTGSLVSDGETSRDGFALVFLHFSEQGGVQQSGVFGAIINVTSDNVGFLYSKVTGSGWMFIRQVVIAPYLPEELQTLLTTQTDSMETAGTSFPCFNYASSKQQMNLKYAGYFSVLQLVEGELQHSQIIIRKGGNNIGAIYGNYESTSGFQLSAISLMINIENQDSGNSKSGVGFLIGSSTAGGQLIEAYCEGNLTTNSNNVGVIGQMKTAGDSNAMFQFAVEGNITGAQTVGALGWLQGERDIMEITIATDLTLKFTSQGGFYGYLSGMSIIQDLIGKVTMDGDNFLLAGMCGAGVKINDVPQNANFAVSDALGSVINTCAGSGQQRPEVNVTSLTEFMINETQGYYAVACARSTVFNIQINQEMSGRRLIQIFKDDACNPSNFEIKGDLTLDTQQIGTTQLLIAGYLAYPVIKLAHFNTTLNINHTGLNGTRMASLFALSPGADGDISFIRISGTINGDSKTDITLGTYIAFLYCEVPNYKQVRIGNTGIFGAQIYFTGADATGVVAKVQGGGYVYFTNILIGNLTNDPKLMMQIVYDRFYYFDDACAIKLKDGLELGLNHEQYLRPYNEGRPTAVVISYRKAHNVGILCGIIAVDGYIQSTVQVDASAIYAQINLSTNTERVGLLAGVSEGMLSTNKLYVSGDLQVRRYAGMIGVATNYMNLNAACKMNITGGSYLGCIGWAHEFNNGVYMFFDVNIKFDEDYVGGFVGLLENCNWFTFYRLVCRSVVSGPGKNQDLLVGYQQHPSDSGIKQDKNYYDGAFVNVC